MHRNTKFSEWCDLLQRKKQLSNWMAKDRILLSRQFIIITTILLQPAQKSAVFTLSASIAWQLMCFLALVSVFFSAEAKVKHLFTHLKLWRRKSWLWKDQYLWYFHTFGKGRKKNGKVKIWYCWHCLSSKKRNTEIEGWKKAESKTNTFPVSLTQKNGDKTLAHDGPYVICKACLTALVSTRWDRKYAI